MTRQSFQNGPDFTERISLSLMGYGDALKFLIEINQLDLGTALAQFSVEFGRPPPSSQHRALHQQEVSYGFTIFVLLPSPSAA